MCRIAALAGLQIPVLNGCKKLTRNPVLSLAPSLCSRAGNGPDHTKVTLINLCVLERFSSASVYFCAMDRRLESVVADEKEK